MKTFNEERAEEIKEALEEIQQNMRDQIEELGCIIDEMGDGNAKAYLLNGLKNLVDKEGYMMMSRDLDITGLIDRVDDHIEDDED
jgi:vacuolar-type H+-ATPase subunit E/Vma4